MYEKDDCLAGVLVLPSDTSLGPGMTLLCQKLRMSRSIALLLVV